MQEGHGAETWAGSTLCVGIRGDTGGREQGPLDLGKKDLCQGRDGLGPVGEKSPQSLGDGNHPLPDRYRWDDAVGEVGGRLRHPAAVALQENESGPREGQNRERLYCPSKITQDIGEMAAAQTAGTPEGPVTIQLR